ncbi:ABC transporter permease [Paenarthrobacter sp. CCNWLY172]|uniref:ABC transporter permease n=1 Tax=Micrococcaceae TaxID=1268 RepID=UPI001A987FC9|nr:ABC transporter permease [Arthrobacter sp. D5-1]QSZ49197.1 hypothetical protein AYX22_12830 [Arthrobacter sp. D5-1]
MIRSLILTKFHFLSMWNWRSVYIGRFIEPIAYLALLGGGLGGAMDLGEGNYSNFVLSGVICLVAFRAATAAVSDVANDRKWGVFAIFMMQGGRTSGYLFSLVTCAVLIFSAQVLLLVLVAWLIFGGGVFTALDMGAYLLIGALVVGGWVGFGAATGARIQSYSKRDLIVTLTTLPVVLAAPLFYPLDSAPAYIKLISALNPLTYQVGWLRMEDSQGWGVAVLAALVWCVVGLTLAHVLLRSAEKVSQER